MTQISVVVPIYNEQDNIVLLHEAVCRTLEAMRSDFEIIFVNDGSSDASGERLDALAGADARVLVLHLARNFGQTAALMAGFDHAAGEVIVAIDGDLQNDAGDIPRLIAKIEEGFDVASGWRVDRKEGLIRIVPSKLANRIIARVTGLPLHDFGCTLKAYRREALGDVQLYGEMHRFIPAFVHWRGGRVAEVPVTHHPRRHGASKYGIGRTQRVLLDLIVVSFLGGGLDRPIQFFGRIGFFSFLAAGIAAAYAVYLKYFEDTSFILTPLPTMVVLFLLGGLILIMMGLLAEIQMRIYFDIGPRRAYKVRTARGRSDHEPPEAVDA